MAKMENTIATIAEIADMMKAKGLTKVAFSENDFKLELEMAPAMIMSAPTMVTAGAAASAPVMSDATPASAQVGKAIRSPIVGTYYNTPAPDKAPFVSVGKKIKKGDVLMIIESMKLMNEITSDMDGTVVDILVSNGTAVDFDQEIMRIE